MKRKNGKKFSKPKALQEGSGTSKQPLLTCNTYARENRREETVYSDVQSVEDLLLSVADSFV